MVLRVLQLGSFGLGGDTFEADLVDNDATGSDASSFSFSGMSFGTPGSDRRIIIAISLRGSSGLSDVDSVTVGGVSATQIYTGKNTGGGDLAEATWWIANPTGTSGTVAVNCGANVVQIGIAVYRVTGLISETAKDTAVDITSVHDVDVATEPGDLVLGIGYSYGLTSNWSGLTEDTETVVDSNRTVSFASAIATLNETRAVSYTSSDGGNSVAAAIVLR